MDPCKVKFRFFHDETFVTLLQKFDKLRSFYKNVGVVRFLMDSNPVHILWSNYLFVLHCISETKRHLTWFLFATSATRFGTSGFTCQSKTEDIVSLQITSYGFALEIRVSFSSAPLSLYFYVWGLTLRGKSLPVGSVSGCLSVCLSVCPFFACLALYSVFLYVICLPVYLYTPFSPYLPLAFLSVRPSVRPSICLPVCLFYSISSHLRQQVRPQDRFQSRHSSSPKDSLVSLRYWNPLQFKRKSSLVTSQHCGDLICIRSRLCITWKDN